jgi:hypothetical protein
MSQNNFLAPRIRSISTIAEWKLLQPHWDEMLANSRADAIFLTWDWIDVWLEVYGRGGQWFILVAENSAGSLIGAAPMMIVRGKKTPGKWIRRLTLIGQQADTASEYLDWISLREFEAEVTSSFVHYLFNEMRSKWDLIQFAFVREDATLLHALRAEFSQKTSAALQIQFQTSSPYLHLPSTWEEFAASRSGSFRNKLNKFHRDHQVELRFGGADMSISEGMALIRELHHKRWNGASSSFTSGPYIRFHDQIAARFYPLDRLILVFLVLDGQIVAGRYDFAYGGKGWNFQGGWLPEWEKLRAGKMLVTEVIRWCISKGLKEYDFLGGDAGYKSDWTEISRKMVNIDAVNPASIRGNLFTRLRKLTQSMRNRGSRQTHAVAVIPATER